MFEYGYYDIADYYDESQRQKIQEAIRDGEKKLNKKKKETIYDREYMF